MCVFACACQLLVDGLCAKHDMQLADFTPHMEPEERWKEGEKEDTLSEDGMCVCLCACMCVCVTGFQRGTSHELGLYQPPVGNGYTDGDKNLSQSSGSACRAEVLYKPFN